MSERPKRRIIPGKEKINTQKVPLEVDPLVEHLRLAFELFQQAPEIISSAHGGDIVVERKDAEGYKYTVFCDEARSDTGYSLDEALHDTRELAANMAKKLDEAEIDYKIIYRGAAVDIIVRPENFNVANVLLWKKPILE